MHSRRKLIGLVANIIGLMLFSGPTFTQSDPPPGGILLLEGYEHRTGRGIDSQVGGIWKPGRLQIRYDIGGLAGNYADNYQKNELKWIRRQEIGNRIVLMLLTKNGELLVTFPQTDSAEPANFMAKVQSEEDVAEALLMVLTYRDPRALPTTRPTGASSTQPFFLEPIYSVFGDPNGGTWTVWVMMNGDVFVSMPISRSEGKQFKGRLTEAELKDLSTVFTDWYKLEPHYSGVGNGKSYPDIRLGGFGVYAERGSNPPKKAVSGRR